MKSQDTKLTFERQHKRSTGTPEHYLNCQNFSPDYVRFRLIFGDLA